MHLILPINAGNEKGFPGHTKSNGKVGLGGVSIRHCLTMLLRNAEKELEMSTPEIKLTAAELGGLAQGKATWAAPWPGSAGSQLLQKWCFQAVLNIYDPSNYNSS